MKVRVQIQQAPATGNQYATFHAHTDAQKARLLEKMIRNHHRTIYVSEDKGGLFFGTWTEDLAPDAKALASAKIIKERRQRGTMCVSLIQKRLLALLTKTKASVTAFSLRVNYQSKYHIWLVNGTFYTALRRMQELGFTKTVRDPEDKRMVRFQATDKGRRQPVS